MAVHLVTAAMFSSAGKLTSGVGTCPGKDDSAEQNHSRRCAKRNKYLRRVLNQAAYAAVKKERQLFSGALPPSVASFKSNV